jgi:hypothetical protein
MAAMEQSSSINLRAFVVHVYWSRERENTVISLAISHKDINMEQPSLMAEMVSVQLTDAQGREWLCIEQPRGQLIAMTGPGMVTQARYVFQPPSENSTPKMLAVAVVDAGTLTLD